MKIRRAVMIGSQFATTVQVGSVPGMIWVIDPGIDAPRWFRRNGSPDANLTIVPWTSVTVCTALPLLTLLK
jgi:hypothetical protein